MRQCIVGVGSQGILESRYGIRIAAKPEIGETEIEVQRGIFGEAFRQRCEEFQSPLELALLSEDDTEVVPRGIALWREAQRLLELRAGGEKIRFGQMGTPHAEIGFRQLRRECLRDTESPQRSGTFRPS